MTALFVLRSTRPWLFTMSTSSLKVTLPLESSPRRRRPRKRLKRVLCLHEQQQLEVFSFGIAPV